MPLRSATVTASGLPATRCEYDRFGAKIGCVDTTISFHADWTGEGPIKRQILNDHYSLAGSKTIVHSNGTSRDAAGTATFNGEPVTGDNLFASIMRDNTSESTSRGPSSKRAQACRQRRRPPQCGRLSLPGQNVSRSRGRRRGHGEVWRRSRLGRSPGPVFGNDP